MSDPYTMHVETAEGVVDHPYHLGTDLRVAESLALEALNGGNGYAGKSVVTVALRLKGKLFRIYDFRDREPK